MQVQVLPDAPTLSKASASLATPLSCGVVPFVCPPLSKSAPRFTGVSHARNQVNRWFACIEPQCLAKTLRMKSTRLEVENRIEATMEFLSRGLPMSRVKTELRQRYGPLSARQIARYASRAREQLSRSCSKATAFFSQRVLMLAASSCR